MHNCTFVLCFALIFSTLALSQIKQTNQLDLNTYFYTSLLNKHHDDTNKQLSASFNRQNTPKPTKKRSHPPNRFKEPLTSGAKLNIHQIKDNKKLMSLYEKMLVSLYKDNLRFKQVDLKQIARLTGQAIKNEEHYLQCIKINDKRLQRIWYKMLKGTKKDHINGSQAYPSVLDYIVINPLQKKAINFLQINHQILAILFNQNTCDKIIEMEQKTERALKKTELEELCQKQNIDIQSLSPQIQYSSSSSIKPQTQTAMRL